MHPPYPMYKGINEDMNALQATGEGANEPERRTWNTAKEAEDMYHIF